MAQPQPDPSQRELVFCHQCENEWYRDEHGIICPECQSDFTEVIDADHDAHDAPDPDEDDIDQFEWRGNAPGEPPGAHGHAHLHRTITLGPGQHNQGGAQALGGLLGLFGPALQGMLGGNIPQQQGQQQGQQGEQQQQPQQRGATYRGEGPGYAYTITTSMNTNLHPRDANAPQPLQTEVTDPFSLMQQIFANIGVAPGGNAGGLEGIMALMGRHGMTGDAVYSQEEYDRVISRLMDQHAAGHAPPPATADAIEALPRRQIVREDLDDVTGKADCSICITEVEIGDEVTVLPCKHWFHHECVKAWLVEHDTCPHCRKGIMPKDDSDNSRPREPDEDPHHDSHQQQQQPPSAGMFNRMREAFAPGGSGGPS